MTSPERGLSRRSPSCCALRFKNLSRTSRKLAVAFTDKLHPLITGTASIPPQTLCRTGLGSPGSGCSDWFALLGQPAAAPGTVFEVRCILGEPAVRYWRHWVFGTGCVAAINGIYGCAPYKSRVPSTIRRGAVELLFCVARNDARH